MQTYLAMAVYGSGTLFPVGIFSTEELANKAIHEVGEPRSKVIIPMKVDENWELERRK